MYVLLDKGLQRQDVWPAAGPTIDNLTPSSGKNLEPHLAFWRDIYPSRDVVVLNKKPNGMDDLDFWSALSISAHTSKSQYDMLRQYWLPQASNLGSVAWLAMSGDGFHGHRGRLWTALPGNLHLSLGIQLNLPASEFSHALTMLPAVCLLDILPKHLLDQNQIGIKWVNDVLIGHQKLAGVLTSTRTEKGIITGAVMGVGLNISQAPNLSQSSFVRGTTCLRDHLGDNTPALGDLVTDYLRAVSHRFLELQKYGPLPLFNAYKSFSLIVGQHVQIWSEDAGGEVESQADMRVLRQGVVQSINPDLGLVLEGQDEPVTRGRLVWKHSES